MEKHYKEMLRFQLMEEISNITVRVTALGKPRGTAERSLVSRYGKLLFLSQKLMDTLPKLQAPADPRLLGKQAENSVSPVIPGPRKGVFRRLLGSA